MPCFSGSELSVEPFDEQPARNVVAIIVARIVFFISKSLLIGTLFRMMSIFLYQRSLLVERIILRKVNS
jgi:hypothetical protein